MSDIDMNIENINAENNDKTSKVTEPGKIRSSITNKLNRKLFFRLFGLFISFNLLICLIAGVALAFIASEE